MPMIFLLTLVACTSTPSLVAPSATAISPTSIAILSTSTPIPPTTPTLVPPTPTPARVLPTLTPTRIPFEFEFLGVPASYNKISRHWSLVDLQLWHNRIYLAHGDWDWNTGPVRAIYYDLDTEKFVQDDDFAFSEQAIEKFNIYNDVLYVPGTDTTQSHDIGNLYYKNWGGKWIQIRTIPKAIHVFDVAVQGTTMAASGPADYPVFGAAYIWTSTDNGRTWKQSFPIHPGASNNVPLQVILFVLEDRIYAATPQDGCFVFSNNTWVKASCLPDSHTRVDKHVPHQNIVVMIPYWRSARNGNQLYFFNGKEQWSVEFGLPVRDAVSTGDGLYVLVGTSVGNGSIFYASSLDCRCAKDFMRIVDFDMSKDKPQSDRGNDPFSLEYANGRFYIGFADGRLFRSQQYVR